MPVCGQHADLAALGHLDLRLDDVEPGDDLGHRVLDLDARVDLDEVEGAGIGIHQELDRAGADIGGGAADLERRLAHLGPLGVVEIGGRRALDHLLVPALDRAVALEQMHEVAVAVAQQLDLDVARALHQLLEIDLVLAERGLGLAPGARSPRRAGAPRRRSGACRARRRPRTPSASPGSRSRPRAAGSSPGRPAAGRSPASPARPPTRRGCARTPCCRACAWSAASGR